MAAAAFFLSSSMWADKAPEVGTKAPEIETISGEYVGNDVDSETKTKIISFWNPKKPESRISNRNLSRQYGKNSDETIEFISICTDSDEDLFKEIVKIDGLDVENTYSYYEIVPRVFKDYGVTQYPKAFMISPEGNILNIL